MRTDNMKTSAKSMLPLLIVIISIFTGVALANGENATNATNVTNGENVTVVPDAITTIPIPIAAPNVTVDITPNVTVTPIATVPIPTPVATPSVTIDITPNVTVPAQVATPNVTVEQNTTVASAPVTDQNVTQGTISKVTLYYVTSFIFAFVAIL